jgi:hypothetical protein
MDKYSILEIKRVKLSEASQREMVEKELLSLEKDVRVALQNEAVAKIVAELTKVNLEIWLLMDSLYSLDAPSLEYTELTWDITIQNQKRAFLKKQIDSEMDSPFTEEKSFF